jgi:hypothetical protein
MDFLLQTIITYLSLWAEMPPSRIFSSSELVVDNISTGEHIVPAFWLCQQHHDARSLAKYSRRTGEELWDHVKENSSVIHSSGKNFHRLCNKVPGKISTNRYEKIWGTVDQPIRSKAAKSPGLPSGLSRM